MLLRLAAQCVQRRAFEIARGLSGSDPSWKIKDDKGKKDWTGHVSISFITSKRGMILMWGA